MSVHKNRITAPELEQFVVDKVQLTGVTLGAGAYGSVEEVEIPGARVAAKKLHPQLINLGSPQQVEKWVTDFVEECKLMSQLRHPHIVQFLGVCYLPGSPIPVLLMEKLQTSLDNLLETSSNIPLEVKVYLLIGTGRGVVYLHSHTPPIAHRDLTARNILVDSGLTAKVADLGVARMVNIQPGQLAATMTTGPGNNLYMPPETVQEEGVTRYNAAIDIFSFGVVSLFTFTQTFPKDLKPHTYFDQTTQRLMARSEIERREEYVELMKATLGEDHSLVSLTLGCLEFQAKDRPSAVEVLRRLEEVGRTVPQNCTETKLELIQQLTEKDCQCQCQAQLSEKDAQINHLQLANYAQLQASNDSLRAEKQERVGRHKELTSLQDAQINHLQLANAQLQASNDSLRAEKQEQVGSLEKLTSLQQQQLEVQRREIEQLSGRLRSLEVQPRVVGSQGSRPKVASPKNKPKVLPSITFKWVRRRERPRGMDVFDQPVTLNSKLYVKGWSTSQKTMTVLEYTPGHDHWAELQPPPVKRFTLATLRGQLVVVGGKDKSTEKITNTFHTFSEDPQQWTQSHLALPTALVQPAVIEYQDHLIVAGGFDSNDDEIFDVNILDLTSNSSKTAQPLPKTDVYYPALVKETLFLLGGENQTVLRAHVPTLISGAKSDVWETVRNAPYYWSFPITIDATLLVLGGRDKALGGNPTSSIDKYDLTTDQWTKVSDLPERMSTPLCVIVNSKMCLLDSQYGEYRVFVSRDVHVSMAS